jgi:hypothetical protein
MNDTAAQQRHMGTEDEQKMREDMDRVNTMIFGEEYMEATRSSKPIPVVASDLPPVYRIWYFDRYDQAWEPLIDLDNNVFDSVDEAQAVIDSMQRDDAGAGDSFDYDIRAI